MEIHLEVTRGTPKEAADYCRKDGEVVEFGSIRRQGSRTDLEEIRLALVSGASEREIAEQYFSQWIRYGKRFKEYQALIAPVSKPNYLLETFSEDWRKKVENYDYSKAMILIGESGIGKTEFALALLPGALVVSHMDQLSEFNSRHNGIIFDDMAFTHMPRTGQIHLVDWTLDRAIHIRYQVALIPKNTKKIFTSNVTDIFEDDPAINRRINKIYLN
jgi:hypothetical protein